MSKVEQLVGIVDQMNASQGRINRDIDARLAKVESRKIKAVPARTIGDRVMGAAKVASYAGPRFGLFLIVTLASIAGAMLGYDQVFGDTGLNQPAWIALFTGSALVLPLSIATFVTRKRSAFKGVKGVNALTKASKYDQF